MPWSIDKEHTSLEFSARHLGILTVRGRFEKFDATIAVADNRPVQADATVQAASVSTREPKRDDHLRSADFFDVANHPEITFHSSAIRVDGDTVEVDGDLTIRGTARPVHLKGAFAGPFADPWGATRIALSLEGTVDRREWGLVWNVPAGERLLVSDDVKLHVDTEVVRQDAAS